MLVLTVANLIPGCSAFFGAVVLLAAAASIYDIYSRPAEGEAKDEAKEVPKRGLAKDLLLAFSLPKNWAALLSTKRSSDDIESVHGIRFFNAMMLLLCHKSMSVFYNGYSNRTEMSEVYFLHPSLFLFAIHQ